MCRSFALCARDSNTFNVPGVQEHTLFLKELADARAVRSSLLRNIELASFPTTTPGPVSTTNSPHIVKLIQRNAVSGV